MQVNSCRSPSCFVLQNRLLLFVVQLLQGLLSWAIRGFSPAQHTDGDAAEDQTESQSDRGAENCVEQAAALGKKEEAGVAWAQADKGVVGAQRVVGPAAVLAEVGFAHLAENEPGRVDSGGGGGTA